MNNTSVSSQLLLRSDNCFYVLVDTSGSCKFVNDHCKKILSPHNSEDSPSFLNLVPQEYYKNFTTAFHELKMDVHSIQTVVTVKEDLKINWNISAYRSEENKKFISRFTIMEEEASKQGSFHENVYL